MKALTTPVEELKQKIEAFEAKKRELMTEKDDFCLLLEGETKKIVTNVLERNLDEFRRRLILQVTENLERNRGEYSGMSLKDLQAHLEQRVIADVRGFHDMAPQGG
ncbi:MAG: hypothetical protein MZW92_25655 [Comamonadaceae bacterium]|nr:hypothetical protein [Comamonadaceae bacterium]